MIFHKLVLVVGTLSLRMVYETAFGLVEMNLNTRTMNAELNPEKRFNCTN